jgi:PKD repeat protein
VSWDGTTSRGLTSDDLDKSSTFIDRRPAVAHRFIVPATGDPFFVVAYEREAPTDFFVHIVEVGLVPTTAASSRMEIVGEQEASREFGRQENVRMQFTLTSPEDALIVRNSDFFGDFDIFSEQWTEGRIAVGGQPLEDFDTPPANIPAQGAGFPWTTSAASPWSIAPGAGPTGSAAAQSGPVRPGETSALSITLTANAPGFVLFTRSVVGLDPSSKGDKLEFFDTIGGSTVRLGYWTGTRPFAQEAFFVLPGTHTFEWKLTRDPASPSVGAPVAWIDDVSFPPVDAPVATSLTASPNPVAVSATATFTAVFSGIATQFDWDFGDGANATTAQNQTTHAYTAAGRYTASVVVTGPGGSDSASTGVTVSGGTTGGGGGGSGGGSGGGGASLTIAATRTSIIRNDTIGFTATASGFAPARFDWDFGDGTGIVTTATPTVNHKYSKAGTFQAFCVGRAGSISATSNRVAIRVAAGGPSGSLGKGGGGGSCAYSPQAEPASLLPLFLAAGALAMGRRGRVRRA